VFVFALTFCSGWCRYFNSSLSSQFSTSSFGEGAAIGMENDLFSSLWFSGTVGVWEYDDLRLVLGVWRWRGDAFPRKHTNAHSAEPLLRFSTSPTLQYQSYVAMSWQVFHIETRLRWCRSGWRTSLCLSATEVVVSLSSIRGFASLPGSAIVFASFLLLHHR
jgi:hypothetical protein